MTANTKSIGFPKWAEITYSTLYADMFMNRDVTSDADFILRTTGIKSGFEVMDQGCGTGRLSMAIARCGANVTGIDIMPEYIAIARKNAVEHNLQIQFIEGNIQNVINPVLANVVFNWYTSWCHADTDEFNIMPFRRAFESLKVGGFYLLDAMNMPCITANFRDYATWSYETQTGIVTLDQWSKLNSKNARTRMERTWKYTMPDGQVREHDTSMLMYSPEEVFNMLQSAGFIITKKFGDISGCNYEQMSPRLIILAQKP